MVRSSPRASAGLRRLAASPDPAWPPAPMSVWASSMNRIMGTGEALTSLMTPFRRFSNSPFTPAPGLEQTQIQGMQGHVLQNGRHIPFGNAQGKALDHCGFSDAGLTGKNRDCSDAGESECPPSGGFRNRGPAPDRSPFLGPIGEIDGVLIQRLGSGRACWPAGGVARFWTAPPASSPDPAVRSMRLDFEGFHRNFLQRIGTRYQHPGELVAVQQGQQDLSGSDLRGLVLHRGEQPGLFDHPRDARRQCRRPALPVLNDSMARVRSATRWASLTSKMLEYFQHVGIGHFQQFDQKMLDVYLVVGLGQAQPGSRFQGAAAGFVEFSIRDLRLDTAMVLSFEEAVEIASYWFNSC
jgi:hypothetical protein